MISVLILTLNEEKNLPECLKSASWSDDIVVFDSYSSDRTVEIAEEFGARVVQRKFDNYAAQRNVALNDVELGIDASIFTYEVNGKLIKALMDKNCTPGSNQIFRYQCYDQIGGYVPLKFGGDDSLCDIMARMHGWKTQSFDDYPVVQHRAVGTGDDRSLFGARFRQGLTDYGIATHPLFMFVKCMRRSILEKPFIAGGMARLAGFIYGYFLREGRKISPEAKKYIRKEQLGRIFGKKINV